MEAGEAWELFDLDTELHVSISEDAKDYLRQFGLEEYNFENYQSTDDPGSYFKDVPREQNPEALFDELTRESIRRNSGRSSGSWNTRPHLTNGRTGSGKVGHVTSSAANQRASLPRQPPKPPDNPPRQRPPPRVDSLNKSGDAPPRSPSKRVSFTEQIDIESVPKTESAASEIHQKHSKSMTNFFGRPKVKGNKRLTHKQDGASGGHSGSGSANRDASLEEDGFQDLPHQNNHIKSKNNLDQKKSKKFKFPAFDMMRNKKVTGNARTNLDNSRKIEDNLEFHNTGHQAPSSSSSQPLTTASISSPLKPPTLRSGIQTLDLISNSPELPELSTQTFGSNGAEGESDCMDSIDRLHGARSQISVNVHVNNSEAKVGNYQHEGPGRTRGGSETDGTMNGVNVVETVSFHEGGIRAGTEGATGAGGEVDGILTGPELHPALIAAVQGDLQTLRHLIEEMALDTVAKIQDERGNTLLHSAASSGQLVCMEYVCSKCPLLGTAENKARHTPAAMAIKHGQIEAVDWLLENLNLRQELLPSSARRRCLLHHAAKFGQDGCLRLLLSKLERIPADYNFSDQHGNTPAHMAAKYGHILCLQTLVEYGFDVCARNQYNQTPCYYADFNNHRHCAGYLMVVETCAHLARNHLSQSLQADWLASRNESICSFTTEALRLSSGIARQSAEDVDVTFRLQQTLDDAMDLIVDMTSQLKLMYERNSLKREDNNTAASSPSQEDLQTSFQRAVELQRHLESFEVNHQRARQQMVRVKEAGRRWERMMRSEDLPQQLDETQMDMQVQHLLRERFSDAVQRLLVYRTTQDSAKTFLSSLQPSSYTSKSNGPDSVSSDQPSLSTSTPLRISTSGDPQLPNLSPLSPTHPSTSSPKSHSSAKHRLSHSEPPPLLAVDSTKLERISSDEDFLHRLSPRARGSDVTKNVQNLPINPALGASFNRTQQLNSDRSGRYGNTVNDISFDRSSTSSSSASGSHKSAETSGRKPEVESRNNVVESFLKDRLFYHQDQENNSKKMSSGGLFYAGSVPSAPSSTTSSDSPRLKFSEFSAFNRVSNRGAGGGGRGDSSIDSRSSEQEIEMPPTGNNNADSLSSHSEKSSPKETVDGQRSSMKNAGGKLVEGAVTKTSGQPTDPSANPSLTIANINRHNEKDNISHVNQIIAQLERKKDSPKHKAPEKDTSLDVSGFGADGLSSGQIKENDSETSSSEGALNLKNKIKNFHQQQQQLPLEKQSAASSSTWESETGSEGQTSEDLSDLDLGPELHGDDLMLGPHGFLDDELEEGDGYGGGLLTPEELLALAPGGRLPLSMQFETSLSTIDEVSVVSESTRAGGETDTETAQRGVDLDTSVDSEGTVTSDDPRLPPPPPPPGRPSDVTSGSLTTAEIITPGFPDTERPWYEMSDEEEGGGAGSSSSTRLQIPKHRLKEHFTIF